MDACIFPVKITCYENLMNNSLWYSFYHPLTTKYRTLFVCSTQNMLLFHLPLYTYTTTSINLSPFDQGQTEYESTECFSFSMDISLLGDKDAMYSTTHQLDSETDASRVMLHQQKKFHFVETCSLPPHRLACQFTIHSSTQLH